jgi:uncharacterized membrane protein
MPEVVIWWYIGIGAVSSLKRTVHNRHELGEMLRYFPVWTGATLVLVLMVLHTLLWLPVLLSRLIPLDLFRKR